MAWKHYVECQKQTICEKYENFYGKYNAQMSIYVKIAHAAAFRSQCEPQKQFADSRSLFRNMDEYFFVCDLSHFCV